MKWPYLSDILVAHPADLLNIGSALRDVLQVVAEQDNLVLLVLGDLDVDALGHLHPAHNLLANEVADLDLEQARLGVLVDVDVDGEMGVDVAHLVLEALGDADDQVVDDGADSTEGSDIFAVAVVDLNRDLVLLGLTEVDSQVTEVLAELSCSMLLDHSRWVWQPKCLVYRSGCSVRIASCWGLFVPRGPSTVTIRVLMLSLTVGKKHVS
jgi:hypothetical protein